MNGKEINIDSVRVFLGFLIAPFAASLVGEIFKSSGPDTNFFAAFLAYPLGIIPGVPAYLIFRRKGWLKLWQIAVAATALGAMEAVPLAFLAAASFDDLPTFKNLLMTVGMFSTAALIVGATFWLIAIVRVPTQPKVT